MLFSFLFQQTLKSGFDRICLYGKRSVCLWPNIFYRDFWQQLLTVSEFLVTQFKIPKLTSFSNLPSHIVFLNVLTRLDIVRQKHDVTATSKFFIMSMEFDKNISDWWHDCTDYKNDLDFFLRLVKWPKKAVKKRYIFQKF